VLKKTVHQPSEMMPDDGAQPARTTAIRLESLKDHVAPQTAERHQLIVVDGLGQEEPTCSVPATPVSRVAHLCSDYCRQQQQQLAVVDGHGQETGSWLAESQQTAELQVLCPQNDESREQAELIN